MPALDWQGVLTGQPLQWIVSGFLTTLWVTLAGVVIATLLALFFCCFASPQDGSVMPSSAGGSRCFATRRCWCSSCSGTSPPGTGCRSGFGTS